MDTLNGEFKSVLRKSKSLHLMLRKDEFFINDQLLKVDLALYTKARELAITLDVSDWGDIRILRGSGELRLKNLFKRARQSATHQVNVSQRGVPQY